MTNGIRILYMQSLEVKEMSLKAVKLKIKDTKRIAN